jgi:hypothetical protein
VDGKFLLKIREFVPEKTLCPLCSTPITIQLDPVPGNTQNFECPKCGGRGQAIRKQDRSVGVTINERVPGKPIDEELLNRVKEAMPTQPWPHGAARTVAVMLGIQKPIVDEAVEELTKRGVFKRQYEGVLYEKLESPNKAT